MLACGLFWAEGNEDTTDSGKLFISPLNCLKTFRKGAYTRKRAITRDNLFAWQGKHLFTKRLLFSSSCELSSLPLKPGPPPLLLSSEWCMILNWLSAGSLIFLWGSHMYRIKFIFLPVHLSYVHLIIRPAKEPRREKRTVFPLLQSQVLFLWTNHC